MTAGAGGKIPQKIDSDVYRSPTPGYQDNRPNTRAVSTPPGSRQCVAGALAKVRIAAVGGGTLPPTGRLR